MERYTYPTFIKCDAPDKAIKQADESYKLPIDLKKAFHYTYVDVHGRQPKAETNPFFDEYGQLLDNSEELRFLSPGIADDTESKIGESRKLGRGIARYILSEHYGYKWFGKIQTLLQTQQDGWTVQRPSTGGDTPDWLISDGNSNHCIGEAKGTHSRIVTTSELVEKWRKQCTNIVVKKDNNEKKLKSWLIVTRFVNENTTDKPEQLIEDPYTEGEDLNENDFSSLNRFIIRNHLSNSLYRISNFRLGLRIQQDVLFEKETNQVMTWRPLIKEISHISFIGKPIGNFAHNFSNFHWRELRHIRRHPELWNEFIEFYEMYNSNVYFDGIAVSPIRGFLDSSYNPIDFSEYNLDNYPFVSLLKDGNIIIPMSLMRPYNLITL